MSVLNALAQKDKGTNPVLPNIQSPPETTGFFQNVGAGFKQAVAGPHSTQNARAIYESRHYDEIVAALNAEGEKATDYVPSPVLKSSPFYRPVPGEQDLPDGRVLIPVERPFANPFTAGPSLTRDVNPIQGFYLGGDAAEMNRIWQAVQKIRARKPDFLKQYPDPSAVDNAALQQRQADEAAAGQVTSRATTLGRVGSFIGGMAGSVASGDPENFVGGWSGAAGKTIAKTVVKRAAEGAVANTAAGIVALPGQEADTERMGQPAMTTGEMAKSVAQNAAAGALFGAAHVVVPEAISAAGKVAGAAVGKVAENLPAPVRDPIVAASIRAGTVKDRQLLYEFQKAHNPYSVVDTSTPTEKAAAHVMTQEVETKEQSPLQPQHDGENNNRLTNIAAALGVDLPPPEQPTTAPVVRPTVRDQSVGGVKPASYLDAVHGAEGTGKNPSSSAVGHFQFTKGTWLEYAPKVTNTAGMSEAQILALRNDRPTAEKAMQLFTADNGAYLRGHGEEDSPGNLSLAHFLGKADAVKALKAERVDPSRPIKDVIDPRSYAANEKTVFSKHQTVGDVVAWANKRIGATVDQPPARPDAVPDEGYDYSSPVPYTVETLRPGELPRTSAEAPTDEPWNPNISQHLLVWEAADGRRELIDGGKRLAHARSLDPEEVQGVTLPTVVLKEADGISEEMAMLVGRLKNVNLGTTSLEEAAGSLADIPEIADALRSPQFKREIAAIAQLPYERFGDVVNGRLDPIAASQISDVVPDERTQKLADQIRSYWRNQKEGGFRRKPIQVISTADGRIKTWAATASKAYVSDKFVPDDGDFITQLRPDDHAALDALISARQKEPSNADTRGKTESRGPSEPPGGAGRDLSPEAQDEQLSRPSEPSLFDRAVIARDNAEKFSEPTSPEAMQQTAMLEHDLRQDAVVEDTGIDPSLHLFDLPETGFRLNEEGNTVSIAEALNEADADDSAAKALRDCL
jgi:hypothetical protein